MNKDWELYNLFLDYCHSDSSFAVRAWDLKSVFDKIVSDYEKQNPPDIQAD